MKPPRLDAWIGKMCCMAFRVVGAFKFEETFLCMHGVHRQVCLLQSNFAANAFFPPCCVAIWKDSIWSRWSPLPRRSRWRSCCWCLWFPATTILFPLHLRSDRPLRSWLDAHQAIENGLDCAEGCPADQIYPLGLARLCNGPSSNIISQRLLFSFLAKIKSLFPFVQSLA